MFVLCYWFLLAATTIHMPDLISLPATAFILLLVFYIPLFGLNNVNQGHFQRAPGARRVSWIEEVM